MFSSLIEQTVYQIVKNATHSWNLITDLYHTRVHLIRLIKVSITRQLLQDLEQQYCILAAAADEVTWLGLLNQY